MNDSNQPSSFQNLLSEYMKKNFDDLMNIEGEKNYIFNMLIAHLLINWDKNQHQIVNQKEPENLDEINQYLDEVINENKIAFEQTIELLKETNNNHTAHD